MSAGVVNCLKIDLGYLTCRPMRRWGSRPARLSLMTVLNDTLSTSASSDSVRSSVCCSFMSDSIHIRKEVGAGSSLRSPPHINRNNNSSHGGLSKKVRNAHLTVSGTAFTVLELSKELLVKIHGLMVKSRVLEERMIQMYKQGDGYFWIGGPGEEAFNVPLGMLIQKGSTTRAIAINRARFCSPRIQWASG